MTVRVRPDIEKLARFYVTDPHDTCDPHEARELAEAFLLERERVERLEKKHYEFLEVYDERTKELAEAIERAERLKRENVELRTENKVLADGLPRFRTAASIAADVRRSWQ